MALVFIAFISGTMFHILTSKEPGLAPGAYILGLFLGIMVCIILNFIPFESVKISANFWVQTNRYFLNYFFVPIIISMPLFLLISFSVADDTISAASVGLQGVFSVMFIMITFSYRSIPDVMPAVLITVLYLGCVFIFDALLQMLLSVLPGILSFIIVVVILLVICFFGCTAFASWHFAYSTFQVLGIALSVLAVGVLLNLGISTLIQ